MLQQAPGAPGVLAADGVDGPQHLDRPRRQVARVAQRGGDDEQGSGLHHILQGLRISKPIKMLSWRADQIARGTNIGRQRVIVRVDRTDAMLDALRAAGADHDLLIDGAISIAGWDTADVGALAARTGVTVIELSRQSAGETLEAMFLSATGGG